MLSDKLSAMIQHPRTTIFVIWLLYVLMFAVLPFKIDNFEPTWFGFLMFGSSILFFVFGSLMVSTARRVNTYKPRVRLELDDANIVLMIASSMAVFFLSIEIVSTDAINLSAAAESRNSKSTALIKGEKSFSSIWFQSAFLLYPAGYAFIAIQLIYSKTVKLYKIFLWGFLPIILATLCMGGRAPIFYAGIVVILSMVQRRKIGSLVTTFHKDKKKQTGLVWFFLSILALIIFVFYASVVFFVRAENFGGSEGMFEIARNNWGVEFDGVSMNYLLHIFGMDITYLIFVFSWYLLQGIVIGIRIFSGYDGSAMMGIYGLELVTALMRRLAPDLVSQTFDDLIEQGVYGFLPSAWGSLYVDFGIACLLICFLWGLGTAICFKKINIEKNARWFILGPFVSTGIIFSIFNTPLGFANGFLTHVWLFIAFFLIRTYRLS